MTGDFDVVPGNATIGELTERIARHDPSVTRHQGLFVVDEAGKLAGVITRADMMRALEKDPSGAMAVLEAGSRDPMVAYPDEVLYDAAARMLRANIGRLPVVSREDPTRVVGYLGRAQVMAARLRRLEEESVRDPGWMRRRKPA
jgi:CBS domain-containing protein